MNMLKYSSIQELRSVKNVQIPEILNTEGGGGI